MGSRYNYKPSGAPIYCSISCGLRSHTDPTNSCIRVCQECGIEFETWNSQPRKYCSRDCSHVHGKNKSAWYTVLGHRCQGKYESLFVVWAVSSGLHFVPHGKGVAMPYVDAKGTDRKYFPDFWVQEWDCYIDIKSDWTKKLAGDKIERVLAANPNVKIRVLADADLIGLGVQVTTKDQYRFKVLMLENGGVLSSIDEWTSMQQREVIEQQVPHYAGIHTKDTNGEQA